MHDVLFYNHNCSTPEIMASSQSTTRAAVIAGLCTILAAGIGAVAVLKRSEPKLPVTVRTEGNGSPGVAIGGSVSGSSITINPSAEELLTAEARQIVGEIIASAELRNQPLSDAPFNRDAGLNDELARNPYNVRALIMRGQFYYVQAKNFGKLRFREALHDFEMAAKTDKALADPRFGIGTVLYYVTVYDLAERGLFKVHKKGVIGGTTGGPASMSPPEWDVFPDNRSKIVLQASLNEFQAGQKLRQLHDKESSNTVLFFVPADVEDRVHTIRAMMGYEPFLAPSKELAMVFCAFRQAIDPKAPLALFNFAFARGSRKGQ